MLLLINGREEQVWQFLVMTACLRYPPKKATLKKRAFNRTQAELARKLEQAGVEDLVIDTDGKSVTAIAWEVLQGCGWMDAEAEQGG